VQAVQPVESGRTAFPDPHRWLLLLLQLPARPTNARVKTWRRLQQIGAIPVKHGVYALPNSAQGLEDFEWLRSEIAELGGHATVFAASSIEGVGETELVELFRTARASDFKQMLADIQRARKVGVGAGHGRSGAVLKELRMLRDRLEHLKGIDFFSAPGAADAEAAVVAIEHAAKPRHGSADAVKTDRVDPRDYRKRTWVTRPRPGVDRFASAWLIQRFIDPDARFTFASDPGAVKKGVPFDMYDAGFSHEGTRCTFEVLQARFGIEDPAVRRMGEVVHDVDLKDDLFHAPQGPTIAMLVEGLRASCSDDAELLRQGMALFDTLYAGLKASKPRTTRRSKATSR
jgi:hypothetical protein